MSKAIKAILTRDVSFTDFDGNARTVKRGASIDVIQVQTRMVSLNLDGRRGVEVMGDFVGTLGNDSFDIERDEFKTID